MAKKSVYYWYILILVLLGLAHHSTCKTYCIVPEQKEADNNSSCMTLNKFATFDFLAIQDSRIILRLHPGNHTLNTSISIFNISEFRIQPIQFANTTILCESQTSFNITEVNSVTFEDLQFLGCGGNRFSGVINLTIENSIFLSSKDSHTALILDGTTSTMINGTIFESYKRGTYLEEDYDLVGGAIVATSGSQVFISNSVFLKNIAAFGGAIYVEGGSITLHECTFSDNNAVYYGSVIFSKDSLILIEKSAFSNNNGTARSRLIVFLNSTATISSSNFTQNTDTIFTFLSSLSLQECIFESNSITESVNSTGLMIVDYGAVLLTENSHVVLNYCTFHANEAIDVGAIIIFTSSSINLNATTFTDNKAYDGTVVMIESDATFTQSTQFINNIGTYVALGCTVTISGLTSFLNNTSSTRDLDTVRGGAITVFLGEMHFVEPSSSTVFSNNFAYNGGALLTVEAVVYISSNVVISNNDAELVGGGIFAYQTPFFVYSSVSLHANTATFGGGIFAVSASITVSSTNASTFHSLTFANNSADHGGGVYLTFYSRFHLLEFSLRLHNISVSFISNHAQYGGAMYVSDADNVEMCDADGSVNGLCPIQVLDIHEEKGIIDVSFDSNSANVSGAQMFGGLLDRCALITFLYPLFISSSFDQSIVNLNGTTSLQKVSNIENFDLISSFPVSICFCVNNQPDCSMQVFQTHVQKGRNFSISVTAHDHVDHALDAIILVDLPSATGGLGDGQQSQPVHNHCTDMTLSVTSTASSEIVDIYPEGPCGNAKPSTRQVNVTFSDCDCPIGFEVDRREPSTCDCRCYRSLNDLIHNCVEERSTFKKKANSWIDYDIDRGFMFSQVCPYDYCLPFDSVDINLNMSNGADVQCSKNRAGFLCGGCQPQFSLSVGQSGCVECGPLWFINTILILLAFLIVGIIEVLLVMFLSLTVTVGTINGFFFSANILRSLFPFPSEGRPTYFISILNMDLPLNVCFFNGFNAYTRAWFEIGFPIYVSIILLLIIIFSQRSKRFSKFIGKRNPIETLATLFFLLYSKLLQFSINALSFGTIDYLSGRNDIVWLPDAHVHYLKGRHIFMFVAAVIVLIAVLLFTLVLLFWQWLLLCPDTKVFSIIRNTKLQSFIGMYHVPNNIKHRYWTGLLLLIRLIVYVITVSTTSFNSIAPHVAIISLLSVLLILKSTFRIYKKWTIDVLESVLILNAIIMTAVSLETDNASTWMLATIYTTNIVFATMFVGLILYHLNHYVIHIDILKLLRKIRSKVSKRSQSQSEPDLPPCVVDSPAYYNAQRRFSILDILGPPKNSEYVSMEVVQATTVAEPSSSVLESFV